MSTANFFQVKYQGINIPSQTTSVAATAGDIGYNSTTNKWAVYNTTSDNLVTESTTQTLTNKTISAAANTISGLTNTNLSGSAGITNANLASMAANTVKANITGSSAAPSDVSLGTVIEATSSVLTLAGWADATIGSPTIQVKQAGTSQSGYLSSTDWNTFNGKQATGNYATSGSGDVSWSAPSGAGPVTTSLVATTNATLTTLSALSLPPSQLSTSVPITKGGTGQATQQAALNALAPQSPTNGQVISYNGTNWVAASPAAGTKNYLTALVTANGTNTGNGNFEFGSTTGWSLAHSSLSGVLPTSTATAGSAFSSSSGGSAASVNLSLTTVSSGQLSGAYSGSLVSSTASVAGDLLISNAFYIDTEDQAKVMTVKLYYTPNSGAANLNFSGTSSNSFAVWVYDVTNGAWIMPAGVYNLVQNSGAGYVTATFQTTSNSTQYQLALVNINASSGAYTLYVDDIFVGPQTAPIGAAVTDWTAFTPTGNWVTNTTYTGRYKRVGDSMECQIFISLSGAPNSVALLLVDLPSGYSIDTTKLPGTANAAVFGTGEGVNGGAAYALRISYQSTTTFGIFYQSTLAAQEASVTNIAPVSWTTGNTLSINFVVPITGWSSNSAMSSDTDTRVVAFYGNNTAGTSQGTSDAVVPWTSQYDSHGAFNSSTNTYTIPVSGVYDISAQTVTSVNNGDVQSTSVYKNGSVIAEFDSLGGSTVPSEAPISAMSNCIAGDTIQIKSRNHASNSLSTNAAYNLVRISRRSGPAVIAATESVNARYTVATATVTSSPSAVTYGTKSFDSHNEYSGSTYTVPVTGKYQVNAALQVNTSSIGGGNNSSLYIYKNGSLYSESLNIAAASTSDLFINISDMISCLAGDTISIQVSSQGSGPTVDSTTGRSYFSIARVGN